MSDGERESPRAAIRSWLNNTSGIPVPAASNAQYQQPNHAGKRKHHSKRRDHASDYHLRSSKQERAGLRPRHAVHDDATRHQKAISAETRPPKLGRSNTKKTEHDVLRSRPNESRLADHLRLHPPFCDFKDQNKNQDVDPIGGKRQRKRERSSSSQISYLETASAADAADINNRDRPLYREKQRQTSKGDGFPSSPVTSQRSDNVPGSGKKSSKLYERRPRHKTRADRYELKKSSKHNAEVRVDKQGRIKEKRKNRKRKDKSGAALMHDFSAQNVWQDRLTVGSSGFPSPR